MKRRKAVGLLLATILAVTGLTLAGCQGSGASQQASTKPQPKPTPRYKITWSRPGELVKTFLVENWWLNGPLVGFIDPETGKECFISGDIRIDAL